LEKLVYENAVEGLFVKASQAAHPDAEGGDERGRHRRRGAAEDLVPGPHRQPLHPAAARAPVSPRADDTKAYALIGSTTLDGYFDTVLAAMAGVLRIVGYERIIDRLPRQMASGSNYQFVEVKRVKPGEAEVSCSDYLLTRRSTWACSPRIHQYFPTPDFKMEILRVEPSAASTG